MQRLNSKNLSGTLEYTIKHRPRVTKRLHMELDDHGGLVVVAPRHWSRKHISATLARNIPLVDRFLTSARKKQLTPLQFIHGEQHLFLGKNYPLAMHHVVGRKTQIELIDGEICIHSPTCQYEKIQASMQNWYRHQARMVFSTRLSIIAQRAPWIRENKIPLTLRRMKRTWGNCSSKGVIKLNTHLVKAPISMIDAVIAHELCHLEEMNHGRAFYTLLEKLNPDWRSDRTRLRLEGFTYLLT